MPTQSTIFAVRTNKETGVRQIYPLTVTCAQEDKNWVATCLELGTSAYAPRFEKAIEEVREAIVLQLSEAARLGVADEYLAQNGVKEMKLPKPDSKTKSEQWHLTAAGA